MKLCKIRKEISHYGIPYGIEGKYIPKEMKDSDIPYRWLDEDECDFQIFIDDKWQDADSIDFDFSNN